jgi:YD repeat-containing protein
MNMKKHVILNFFLSAAIVLFNCTIATAQELPKIVYPSPEASNLFRYQDYPMDYSMGLPQISIPLYVVKSGSLEVPLSISYHASGRRVYDQDGPIAVGWTLNAGGSISRTIYGSADFHFGPYGIHPFPFPFVTSNLTNLNDYEYLEKIMHYNNTSISNHPWYDSEYDVFSYSIGDKGGKFIFKDSNSVKTPVLLPYKPYIVEHVGGGITQINITDDKGTKYFFVAGETYAPSSHNAYSGWELRKILSADKTDSITFAYTNKGQIRTTISRAYVLIDDWTMELTPFPTENPTQTETTTTEEYGISRLTEITFKQGKVVFNLESGGHKVTSIQIKNLQNQVIKTIELQRSQCYSQSELGTAANKLDALIFKGQDGIKVEEYTFEHYPLISSNGQINPRHCDWWGYYNNSGVQDNVPYWTNIMVVGNPGPGGSTSVGNPLANRNPALEPLKSGVLKKIKYPTGGSTEFIYEKNQCTLYGSNNTPVDGPGLRVYQIKSTDNNGGLTMLRTFKYGVNESGYGSIDLLPEMSNMATELTTGYIDQPCFDPSEDAGRSRQRTFLSGFIPELADLASRPVVYTEVTEYQGTETNNNGKTVYKYGNSSWAASGMPALAPLMIPKKHIYNYCYWKNPLLLSQEDYKRIGSGVGATYQKVREVGNTYSNTTTGYITGLHVQRNYSVPQTGVCGTTEPWYSEEYVIKNGWGNPFTAVPTQLYTFSDYRIEVGYQNLMSTGETFYNEAGDPVSTGSAFTYNAKQLQSSVIRTESDGSTITVETKYPFDYTGNATLTQMAGLNMLDFPVEIIETKNTTTPVKSLRNNYFNWGSTNPMIELQTIELKNGSNVYETRVRYHSYDAIGNVTGVSKENDLVKVYIWGYDNTYPVAELTGISYNSAVGVLNQTIIQNPSSDQALRTELNKIRQSFPAAIVTTYTYQPLIGVTSVTDAGGRTTFYEYDSYGRLKLIKDLNGNILKTFKYQYQGVTAN